MRHILVLLLLLASFAASVPTHAQGAAIVMDGTFEDWSPGLATFVDNNAPASGIDLLSMQVTNDETHLYIKLVVGTEIDLLDDLVPHGLCLFIDGDNNASTGNVPQSGYGAELRVRFDTRTVTEYYGASSNVSWSNLDLVPLPTVTNDTFEVAIARSAKPDGVNDLFSSGTIRVLLTDLDNNDRMPNSGSPAFTYTFDDTFTAAPQPITVARDQASHVRITAWNVLGDGITNAALQGEYQRILTALAPDVLGLSECVNSTAAQVKTRLDNWLPIGGTGWYVVKDDFDMVIASRWPIVQSWPGLSRQFPALIDLPPSHATDLLFTAAHLNCCTADATRQAQCDAYVQFVQDAKSAGGTVTVPSGTPMVYAGDLNSVGWAQQLTTLLTGDIQDNATYGPDGAMDWDGTGLARAACRHTDTRMAYTWRSNTSAYPSGLLDHLFYTDDAATLMKSFALRTATMPAGTLAALGLQASDAGNASDHLPITADLALPAAGVDVQLRAVLKGPYDANTGLMHDSLRTRGLIPTTEPYTALGFAQVAGGGGETTTSGVLAAGGPDAVVDWVLLELRAEASPAMVTATRSALLQRDGDVVDVDGSSPVHFNMPEGPYHVALRHRNHLGAMTAAPVQLGSGAATIDLSLPGTALYGTEPTDQSGSTRVMWAGNAVRDGFLRYTGATNDRDAVLTRIGGVVPTQTAQGYLPEDLNLDGLVKYTGGSNDRDIILQHIGGTVPTSTRAEQLP